MCMMDIMNYQDSYSESEVLLIEQASDRARDELAQEAGEDVASEVATVFFNALSDVAVRTGMAEEQAFAFYLRFSRRVCNLTDCGQEANVCR